MLKHVEPLADFLRDAGAERIHIAHGGKHPRLVYSWEGRERFYVVSHSPGDRRSTKNAISDLRRSMGLIPAKQRAPLAVEIRDPITPPEPELPGEAVIDTAVSGLLDGDPRPAPTEDERPAPAPAQLGPAPDTTRCRQCRQPFTPRTGGGTPQRYCSHKCRRDHENAAHAARLAARAANAVIKATIQGDEPMPAPTAPELSALDPGQYRGVDGSIRRRVPGGNTGVKRQHASVPSTEVMPLLDRAAEATGTDRGEVLNTIGYTNAQHDWMRRGLAPLRAKYALLGLLSTLEVAAPEADPRPAPAAVEIRVEVPVEVPVSPFSFEETTALFGVLNGFPVAPETRRSLIGKLAQELARP